MVNEQGKTQVWRSIAIGVSQQVALPEVKRRRCEQDKANADFPTGRLLIVNEQGKTQVQRSIAKYIRVLRSVVAVNLHIIIRQITTPSGGITVAVAESNQHFDFVF